MAERRIVEGTGQGIVCYISNYSWLDGLSFTGMRERYLSVFDKIWIDNLNGDKYKTGKLTPEANQTPVSSQGTLTRRHPGRDSHRASASAPHIDAVPCVSADLWGRSKRRPERRTAVQDGRESVPAS